MIKENKVYKTKTSGKLFLAGEYAVVEKGIPAIVFAIDRFIYSEIKESKQFVKIKSNNNQTIVIKRNKNKALELNSVHFSYVLKSINLFERLVKELNKEVRNFSLKINSDLQNEKNLKYGLGSSAAVVTNVIKSLSLFYNIPLSKNALFKISAIVNFKENKRASAADIAASVYGGMLYFVSFDKEWLENKLKSLSIKQLISIEWPNLKIKKIKIPQDFKVLVGWTKSPVQTNKLVKKVFNIKNQHLDYYNNFLLKSKRLTDDLANAIEKNKVSEIENLINSNRKLLKEFSKNFNIEIETEKLNTLISLANKHGLAAKTSGAGGGDCGIAIAKTNINNAPLSEAWQKNAIQVLDINIFEENQDGK